MARDYIRNITDMERYFYGAGNAMGYSYSGSELLKADAPMLRGRGKEAVGELLPTDHHSIRVAV